MISRNPILSYILAIVLVLVVVLYNAPSRGPDTAPPWPMGFSVAGLTPGLGVPAFKRHLESLDLTESLEDLHYSHDFHGYGGVQISALGTKGIAIRSGDEQVGTAILNATDDRIVAIESWHTEVALLLDGDVLFRGDATYEAVFPRIEPFIISNTSEVVVCRDSFGRCLVIFLLKGWKIIGFALFESSAMKSTLTSIL